MKCLIIIPTLSRKVDLYAVPQGPAIISAVAKGTAGVEVFNLNLNFPKFFKKRDRQVEAVTAALETFKPDVVMCGGQVDNYREMFTVFKTVKEYNPGIATVAGGLLISGDPVAAMTALEYVDYGIVGEGEVTARELLEALAAKATESQMEDVAGLIMKRDGGFVSTGPRALIRDWTAHIPWADYDAFGRAEIAAKRLGLTYMTVNNLNMSSSRGCVAQCTFCYNPFSGKYRQRPLDDFFNELETLMEKYGRHQNMALCDDMMATSKERIRDFCSRMRRLNAVPFWEALIRAPQVDKEVLALLEGAGCERLFVGIESIHESVLKSMNKKVSFEKDLERIFELFADSKIEFIGNIILGDLAEDYEMALKSLEWSKEAAKKNNVLVHYRMLRICPGSKIYRDCVTSGKIKPVDFIKNYSSRSYLNVSKMTDDEYNDIYDKVAMVDEDLLVSPLTDMKVTYNFKLSEKEVRGLCRKCGRELVMASTLSNLGVLCPYCGSYHRIPVLEPLTANALDAKKMARNLQALLGKYRRIVFWGVGRLLDVVPEELLKSDQIFLVDKSANGRQQAGKTVWPTAEINSIEPDCFVVSVNPHSLAGRDIYGIINEKYPAIDALSLWQLNFEDLS